MFDDHAGPNLGPCQAIWRRIAYVTAELLLQQESGDSGDDADEPVVNMIAVNLRPMAQAYLGALLREIVAAGQAGIGLNDLCRRAAMPIIASSTRFNGSVGDLMTEAVRRQFPAIFARPLVLPVDGQNYAVAHAQGGRLTAMPVDREKDA